ncbi:MAG: EAL domain-containing protein [Pseudomonadota bacterium]
MWRAISGSLRKKFALALLATVVAVFPISMVLVDQAARSSMQSKLEHDRGVEIGIHAAALAKPLYDFDYGGLSRLASIIATADHIDNVVVLNAEDVVVAGAELVDASRFFTEATIVHRAPAGPEEVGLLRVWYNGNTANRAINDLYLRTALVLVASIIASMVMLMFGLRRLLLDPLQAMMRAIVSSQSGARIGVDWSSDDEVGQLVSHFNKMQQKLSREEQLLKAAHADISALYNQTPAMLFSIDAQGQIADVSDYWLAETGYQREEVVGRRFGSFLVTDELSTEALSDGLDEEESGDLPEQRAPISADRSDGDDAAFHRWNCRFLRKDGETIDVFVSQTRRPLGRDGDSRSLLVMVDISELKSAEAELLRRARTDSLTGLPNRRHFREKLRVALDQAERARHRVSVFFIDLDRFKWVNDHLGHHAGDKVLNVSAARILEVLPEGAFFARLGGDEFAVFVAGGDEAQAAAISRAINDNLSQPCSIAGADVSISASIGVADFPNDAASVGGLLRAADLAMYRTKRAGRRGFSSYDASIGDEARRIFEIEEMMRKGATHERFHLDFQPIVRLSDEQVIGAEGLLRMRDLNGGIVSPADFIPVAEECGLMPTLGTFALQSGAEGFAGLAPYRLSINLSPLQISEDLPEMVAESLERTGFPGDRLVLEITESVFLQEDAGLLSIFERVRRLGCKLALDDFGTGYSSLSYLNDFPVDILKIDRQFVRRLDCDGGQKPDLDLQRRTAGLLQGVATIAEKLEFITVAEGVETEEQRDRLRDMGFECGQGFLWSKPVHLDLFIEKFASARMRSEHVRRAATGV